MDEIAEAELLGVLRRGLVLDGGLNGARRTVSAGLLRKCCHELKDQVDPRGLNLKNVVVAGRLDLAGLAVPFPLRFEKCKFDSAPVVAQPRHHARLAALINLRPIPRPAIPEHLTASSGDSWPRMGLRAAAGLLPAARCLEPRPRQPAPQPGQGDAAQQQRTEHHCQEAQAGQADGDQ
jgi:hypothetical protein